MQGKRILFTGCTSGLGRVAAIEAVRQGATLFAFARDPEKGYQLQQESGNPSAVIVIVADLCSLNAVADGCKKVRAMTNGLDMIIHNAGIMNFKFIETEDGFEETFQVTILAPMLINHLVIDLLIRGSEPRIINTVSGLHQGIIDFDNLEYRKGFRSFKSYRQAKLGMILLTRLLAERLAEHNVVAISQHPGMVNTALGKNAGWLSRMIFKWMGGTPEEGAQTLLFLMKEASTNLVSGEYYAKKKVERITEESYDLSVADQLWTECKTRLARHLQSPSIIFPE